MGQLVFAVVASCALVGGVAQAGRQTEYLVNPLYGVTIAIPGADSAQLVDAQGRKMPCKSRNCVEIPGASYGAIERGVLWLTLDPQSSGRYRLIAWAKAEGPFPQVSLYGAHGVRCHDSDDVRDVHNMMPGTRCEWILDVAHGDSLSDCKLTLKRLRPKPSRRTR